MYCLKQLSTGLDKPSQLIHRTYEEDFMTASKELNDALEKNLLTPSQADLQIGSIYIEEYLTFSQAAQRFPAFTEGSLRWHRFNNTGGFNRCVRQIGRKCVISLRAFLIWMEEQTARN